MRNGKTAVATFRRSRVPTMEKLICFIWEWNISIMRIFGEAKLGHNCT